MKTLSLVLSLVLFVGIAVAGPLTTTPELAWYINSRLKAITDMLHSIVAPVAVGLFVLAGLVYAVGQVFDQQTRAKAQAWSMSIVTGVLVGILIIVFAPLIISLLWGIGN